MSSGYVKYSPNARTAAWEAAGLRWLAAAKAVPVVEVLGVDGAVLRLEELQPVRPTREAAERFGHELAALHAAGATAFGVGPDGWGCDGYLGPNDDLLPLPLHAYAAWGSYYANSCVAPTAARAIERGGFPESERDTVDRLCERLDAGDFDDDLPPARIHGDLWSGNVVWTERGATLIDCAAHGGHRETDLAMLALFGFPHLETVLSAYEEAGELADGWRDYVALHQVFHLLVHCACFGTGYVGQTLAAMRRYV